MRTFHFTKVMSAPLVAGSLAFLGATAIAAAEPAKSSVNFVDRNALASRGWSEMPGNPLRAGGSAAGSWNNGNTLRGAGPADAEADEATASHVDGNVQPASHQASSPASRGLQLRPHSEQTGIFSGWFGAGAKTPAKARPQRAPSQVVANPGPAPSALVPPKTAAQRALGMLPTFQSNSARQQAQQSAVMPTAARSGSVRQSAGTVMPQRPTDESTQQAAYTTAASAQAYRRPTNAAQRPRLNHNPAPLAHAGRMTPPATKPRPAARPATRGAAQASSVAKQLAEAHQLAESARTEAEFSTIFSLCQQIPASRASDEEAQFGRQLAAWSLNRRGQLRAKAGDDEAAMADFDLAIRVDTKCWRALHNRGVLLAQAGQFEGAFDDFHHTIELNPDFAKAYSNRAALYVLAGELEPALADYERAIELDANLAVAHRGCGRMCHQLGRLDESLEHLTTAIELAPKDAAALASRGDLLTDLGEYETAANDYERALAANAKSADACRGSAWLLATCPDDSVRNPELALERAELALTLDRKASAVALDTLAAAQAGIGDFAAARQTIRRAIELAPPSERSVYQDRLQMYRQSQPYRIAPLEQVQPAGYER